MRVVYWNPPSLNVLKSKSDGISNTEPKVTGIGSIIQDSNNITDLLFNTSQDHHFG